MQSKQVQLQKLKHQMEEDTTLPLKSTATRLVFGEGNPDAKIYFLGEAPGLIEDQTGRPFVGRAGKLLDKLLHRARLSREDVYITSIVRFRPPQNREPKPEEIKAFAPYVEKEIAIIDPRIVITLGRFSLNKFLPEAKVSEIHGEPQKITFGGKEIILIPMYHPAAGLRSIEILDKLEKDFKSIPHNLLLNSCYFFLIF